MLAAKMCQHRATNELAKLKPMVCSWTYFDKKTKN